MFLAFDTLHVVVVVVQVGCGLTATTGIGKTFFVSVAGLCSVIHKHVVVFVFCSLLQKRHAWLYKSKKGSVCDG